MASHSACLFLYSIYICKRGFIIYISAFRLLVEKQPYKIKLLQKTSAYICKRRCYAISKEIESLKPRSKFLNKKKKKMHQCLLSALLQHFDINRSFQYIFRQIQWWRLSKIERLFNACLKCLWIFVLDLNTICRCQSSHMQRYTWTCHRSPKFNKDMDVLLQPKKDQFIKYIEKKSDRTYFNGG